MARRSVGSRPVQPPRRVAAPRWRLIQRVALAKAADAADGCQALLEAVEAAICGAVTAEVVDRAPRIIPRLGALAHQRHAGGCRHKQKPIPHVLPPCRAGLSRPLSFMPVSAWACRHARLIKLILLAESADSLHGCQTLLERHEAAIAAAAPGILRAPWIVTRLGGLAERACGCEDREHQEQSSHEESPGCCVRPAARTGALVRG